ncbi:DUF2752 domain-containing protein [Actinopolymorpha alba]|uniref:DUF2752 domain-containing protein n=1 Tax=Actinopolymorpha alba TaxID=533267 RepID=UPI0003748E44|nr:DUF2752 domain-containing protein [Actinopolymorpha alba]
MWNSLASRTRNASPTPPDHTLAGVAAIGVGGLALAGLYAATGGEFGIPCLLRATTGLDCPFCGSTRMAAALLHGDVLGALHFNAPVLVGVLVVAYLWTSWVLQRLGLAWLPRPRLRPRARRILPAALIVMALAFMVIRNLPWPPFTALHV